VRGYSEALEQSGIASEPELMVPAHFTVESGEASVDALIARGVRFDGIVAASDLIALGAVRSLMNAAAACRTMCRWSVMTTCRWEARCGRSRMPTELIVRGSCVG
jgi:6,7-dimethyl-8-ribityllumazine synthase